MTWGRKINGHKFICLVNDNEYKMKSLEDNVYFTLRDIFANCDYDLIISANDLNGKLTNNIYFEDRDETFKYTNVLYEKDYVKKLLKWIMRFKKNYFMFNEFEQDENKESETYMNLDDWWNQFEELRTLIKIQYEKLEKWEAEDVERDTDRLAELSDDQDD